MSLRLCLVTLALALVACSSSPESAASTGAAPPVPPAPPAEPTPTPISPPVDPVVVPPTVPATGIADPMANLLDDAVPGPEQGATHDVWDDGPTGLPRPPHRPLARPTGPIQVVPAAAAAEVRRTLLRNLAQLQLCFEQQVATSPELAGRVMLAWTIQPSGVATDVRVTPTGERATAATSTAVARAVEPCFAAALGRWTFALPAGGESVSVRQAITLELGDP